MNDYIKREDAIKAVIADAKLKNLLTGNCENEKAIEGMIYGVLCPRDIPSADVVERSSYESMEHTVAKLNEALSNSVEVVRCKDCRLYNTDNCYMIHGQRMNRDLFEDDFCSYGERGDA